MNDIFLTEFNQVVIFVRDKRRCATLNKILKENKFPAIELHSDMAVEERFENINSLYLEFFLVELMVAFQYAESRHTTSSRSSSLVSWLPPISALVDLTLSV